MHNIHIHTDLKPNLVFFELFGFQENAIRNSFEEIKKGFDLIKIDKKKEIVNSIFSDIYNYLLTGIDVPVLITRGNSKKRKKVIIVGSEPLRNWRYFEKNELDVYSHIALNTPFSVHQHDGFDTLYGKIILEFLKTHDVYVTDVRKIWFAGFNYHNDFLNDSIHSDFLLAEFESFNDIDHFITFGQDSYRFIKKLLNDDPRVKYIIHPSRRTLGNQRKSFFASHKINTDDYSTHEEPYFKLVSKITAITTPTPH